jgi:hypothetical protein
LGKVITFEVGDYDWQQNNAMSLTSHRSAGYRKRWALWRRFSLPSHRNP